MSDNVQAVSRSPGAVIPVWRPHAVTGPAGPNTTYLHMVAPVDMTVEELCQVCDRWVRYVATPPAYDYSVFWGLKDIAEWAEHYNLAADELRRRGLQPPEDLNT